MNETQTVFMCDGLEVYKVQPGSVNMVYFSFDSISLFWDCMSTFFNARPINQALLVK